jgi:hypothetical protein
VLRRPRPSPKWGVKIFGTGETNFLGYRATCRLSKKWSEHSTR